ncbi:hypothetical protein KCMC57_64510 (plasmid) [Kitasatospora sp. CMC57]|uniref:Secreted protein n=1 Tax=Kitasatospora sp. CMC57 TaxID=3231513 RepID=A0AB33K4F1_9ACTN
MYYMVNFLIFVQVIEVKAMPGSSGSAQCAQRVIRGQIGRSVKPWESYGEERAFCRVQAVG